MTELLKNISVSTILFVISGALILLCLVQKNSNFFDVKYIVLQHFKVFEKSPLQCFVIFVVPMFFALGTVQMKTIDKDIINNLNIVLSILISMFFAMLSILCAFNHKSEQNAKLYNQLLNETFNAVIFECVLCIVLLLVSFIQLFINDFKGSLYLAIISTIIYYLAIVVVLNIFVIIKRIKILFDYKDND